MCCCRLKSEPALRLCNVVSPKMFYLFITSYLL